MMWVRFTYTVFVYNIEEQPERRRESMKSFSGFIEARSDTVVIGCGIEVTLFGRREIENTLGFLKENAHM